MDRTTQNSGTVEVREALRFDAGRLESWMQENVAGYAGPLTVEKLVKAMALSRTLIWNGPLGVFEVPPFDAATVKAAQAAAQLTTSGALVAVAGGGDTVAALHHAKVADDMTFVSTAGGAFLEWMEGKTLPGVEALRA